MRITHKSGVKPFFILTMIVAVCGLTACAPQSLTDEPIMPADVFTVTPAEFVSPTLETSPMPETSIISDSSVVQLPTPAPVTLRLWLPEPLAPVDNEDAAELLSEQISGFQAANPDIRLDLRLKRPNDTGGIMSTLISANVVAPNALPDLTLFRRADLINAVESDLIESLDAFLPVAMLGGLPATVVQLGQVNGQIMGVPYALDVAHFAYHPAQTRLTTFTFDEYLSLEIAFIAPLAQTAGISDVLLAQVVAAGGIITPDGGLQIDADSLTSIFAFYAGESGLEIPPLQSLEYTTVSDYRTAFMSGEFPAAFVYASDYLTLTDEGASITYAVIPTTTGETVTVFDGWMWVVTTSDTERQRAAMRFLSWMFEAGRQAQYTRTVAYVPSQRAALALWEDLDYAAFLGDLLDAGVPRLTGSAGIMSARVLQSALASVINGQLSPSQAALEAVAQLDAR